MSTSLEKHDKNSPKGGNETFITLPNIPYRKDAFASRVRSRIQEFPHGKDHQAHVDHLNELIEGTDLTSESFENIIRKTAGRSDLACLCHNAAQVGNPTSCWRSMKPVGGGSPAGPITLVNWEFVNARLA